MFYYCPYEISFVQTSRRVKRLRDIFFVWIDYYNNIRFSNKSNYLYICLLSLFWSI